MVAVFVGQGAGYARGSGNLLGGAGLLGSGSFGRGGENISVNAATGNLLIAQQDEFLVGRGPDAAISRTYNSLAQMSDGDNGDQWQMSTVRRVFGLTGTLNTAGSTISRQSGDGSVIVYSWNAATAAYVTTDGDGAHDELVKSGATWIRTDGSSQQTETYEVSAGDANIFRIKEQKDTDGYKLNFAYVAGTDKLYRVTTHNHGTANADTGIAEQSYVEYSWSGNNITQIVTGYTDYGDQATQADNLNKTLTRTRYGYDASNRLVTVTVDLSPENNSISDGKTYVTTYTYDGTSDRVASITQTDGSSLAIAYDASGRVQTLSQTVAAGDTRVTRLAYGSNYTSVTGPDGQVTRLDYDAAKQLTKITAPPAYTGAAAQTVQFGYDADGNVASATDAAGEVMVYTHDANGNQLTGTDPNGHVVTRTYGAKNELLTETRTGSDATGASVSHTTRYAYDVENHLRFVISPEGRVTEYTYHASGELASQIEYPEHNYSTGGSVSLAEMAAWKAAQSDLSSIRPTYRIYDGRGQMTSIIHYGAASTTGAFQTVEGYTRTYHAYDQSGHLLSRFNAYENTEAFVYDGLGRLVASSDLAGGTTTVVFNDAATTTIVASSTGKVTTSVFNKAGDLISEIETENQTNDTTVNFPAVENISNWTSSNTTSSSAGTINGQPAVRYAVAGTASGQSQQVVAPNSVAVVNKDVVTATIVLQATTSSSSAAFGIHGTATGWGYGDMNLGTARIVSGPGVVTKAWSSEGFFYVTGLSATEPTIIEIQRRFVETQTASVRLYPDLPNGSIQGNAIIAAAPSMSKSTVSESFYLYDKQGRVRVATDATGYKSFYLYDKAGRKIADINHYGQLTEYRYDAAGRVAATASYTYALTAAQIAALSDPDNDLEMAGIRPAAHSYDIWSWSIYDDAGRLIQSIDSAGGVAVFSYDASDRLIKTVSYYNKLSAGQLTGFKATPPSALILPTANTAKDAVSRSFYDRDGRLIGTLDGEGYLSEIVYDKAGQKVEEIAYAAKTSASYWASGSFNQLRTSAAPTSSANRRMHYVYDGQGLLRFTVDSGGFVTSHAYNYAGKATTAIVHAAPISTSDFTYDNVKALVAGIANETNDRESYNIYNANGQVAYTIDSGNAVAGFAYDVAGNIIRTVQYAVVRNTPSLPTLATMDSWASGQASNGANRVTRNWYTAGGDLRFAVDGEGYVKRFDYDAEGRLTREVSWTNEVTATDATIIAQINSLANAAGSWVDVRYTYDAAGRRNSVYDGEGNRTVYSYHPDGLISSIYAAYGTADQSVTHHVYDGAGRLIAEYAAYGEPEQAITQYSYDGLGNRTSVTDPRGKVTSYTYDERGQVLTMTDAASGVTTYEYNAFGEVVKLTDPRGKSSYSYYDDLGRVTLTRDAESHVTETSYTAFGEVASIMRRYNKTASTPSTTALPAVTANAAKDATTAYVYDKRGQITSTTDAAGIATTSVYDAFGHLASLTRAGATTSFLYDHRGLVTKSTDAEGFFESYGYDALGNRTSVVAKSSSASKVAGGTTTYTYDKRGLLLSETLPVASYNADGSVQAATVTNSYAYDGRGNRIQMIEAAGLAEARTTTYAYDKLDRLVTTSGQARTVLDQANHTVFTPGFVPTETIVYDAAGNITSLTDAAGQRSVYFYDNLGRKAVEINAAGTYTRHAYDANGNITSTRVYEAAVTVPANGGADSAAPAAPGTAFRETLFTYDDLGRLTKTSVTAANSSYTLKTGSYSGGAWTSATTPIDLFYEYDAFGNVAKTIDGNTNATWSYYDKLGRKTAEVDAAGYRTDWAYDNEGNVLTEKRYANAAAAPTSTATPPAVTVNASFDRVTTFTYDKNGNRLSEARSGVAVHNGSGGTTTVTATLSWLYNGLGQVIRKTEATGDQTHYSYDAGGRLTQEVRAAFTSHQGASVSPTVDYRYTGLGDLARTVAAGAGDAAARVTTYTYGAGGLLASMTDATGVVHSYAYDKRGALIRDQYNRANSAGTSTLNAVLTKVDALGRTIEQAVAAWTGSAWAKGDIAATEYNAFGEVAKTGVNGIWQQENKYDAAGRVWATNGGDGVWKYYGYDKNGNQTIAIASAGYNLTGKTFDQAFAQISLSNVNATYTVYDARNLATSVVEEGRLLSASSSQTLTTGRTYNAFGEVVTESDALGAVTSYAYNNIGRMIRSEGPTVSITLENGAALWVKPSQDYYYDVSGRLVATRDANGSYAAGGTSGNGTSKAANSGNLTRLTLLAGTGYGGGASGSGALVTAETQADGGVKTTKYDIHGDARTLIDAVNRTTTQLFDTMGRVTQVTHAGGLIDTYSYDSVGQRLTHWNNLLGISDKETTDYDVQGRVTSSRAFGGDVTTTSTTWDATIAAIAGVVTGGWTEVTTMANGRTLTEKSDIVGRVTWKNDLGSYVTTYAYDVAGRQTSSTMGGVTTTFTYYNTGQLATNTGPAGAATYSYDKTGNRLTEVLVSGGVTIKNQSATYDAMGRLKAWNEAGTAKSPAASTTNDYDAGGNIRRTQTSYRMLDANGIASSSATSRDYWFAFDAMNRLVIDKGMLSGTAGAAGTVVYIGTQVGASQIAYNLVGERMIATTKSMLWGTKEIWVSWEPGWPSIPDPGVNGEYQYENVHYLGNTREDYAYDGAGRLATIRAAESSYHYDDATGQVTITHPTGPGAVRSSFSYDGQGRQTAQSDYDSSGTVVLHNRTASYNAKGQLTSDSAWTRKSDSKIHSASTSYYYTDYTSGAYSLGSVAWSQSVNGVTGQSSVTSRTINGFAWYDSAVQATIAYDSDTGSGSNPIYNTSFTYNGFGQLTSVYIGDGKPRTVTFTNDELGQVIRRDETNVSGQTGAPHEVWYRFAGRQLGYTGNNGTDALVTPASISDRQASLPTNQGTFRNGQLHAPGYADFVQSYDPLNSYNQGSAGGGYRVRAGDTLSGIALAVYGDANLWYKIAEANGMSGNASLVEGQTLTLPVGISRSSHSASTFKAYDPAEAIGELSPTTPKPSKKPKCGGFGMVLLAVVAIAVTTIATAGAASALSGQAFGAVLGAMTGGTAVGGVSAGAWIAGGAIGGAIGSMASQGVGVATGIQSGFSWKGVGLAAIAGGIGGAVGGGGLFGDKGLFGGGAVAAAGRGAVGSVLTQGIGVATGLQSKFDFAGVAAAGVGAGIGNLVGGKLDGRLKSGFAESLLANTAGGIANAATRSAINGNSFGDNLRAAIPDIIGNTIGNLMAKEVSGTIAKAEARANYREIMGSLEGQAFLIQAGYNPSEPPKASDLLRQLGDISGPADGETMGKIRGKISDWLQSEYNSALKVSDTTFGGAALHVNTAIQLIYSALGTEIPNFQWTYVGGVVAKQVRGEIGRLSDIASGAGTAQAVLFGPIADALGMSVETAANHLIRKLIQGQITVATDVGSYALAYQKYGAETVARIAPDDGIRLAFRLQADADKLGYGEKAARSGMEAAFLIGRFEQTQLQPMWNDPILKKASQLAQAFGMLDTDIHSPIGSIKTPDGLAGGPWDLEYRVGIARNAFDYMYQNVFKPSWSSPYGWSGMQQFFGEVWQQNQPRWKPESGSGS